MVHLYTCGRTHNQIQWNLQTRDTLGLIVLAGSEMGSQRVYIRVRSKMGAGQRAQQVAVCNLAFKLSDQISVVASQSLLWLDKRSSQIISLIFDSGTESV